MSEEDDRTLDRKFADIRVELEALRLMMNEVFWVALALYEDPANAVVAARRHITETIERAETMAIAAGSDSKFQKWYFGKVSASVGAQLDEIERRVSLLRHDQATH